MKKYLPSNSWKIIVLRYFLRLVIKVTLKGAPKSVTFQPTYQPSPCIIDSFHIKISRLDSEFGLAFKVAELSDFAHPLSVHLPTTFNANHATADLALQALILFFKNSVEFISTNCDFGVALAAPAICTDTSSTLSNLDKVMIFQLGMSAVGHAELAEVRIFIHLFRFTASETNVIVVALG
jgi:hypothetical protein